jgi:hypothetical protein
MVKPTLIVFVVALCACDVVQLKEDSKAVCANGIDDDKNGLTDCQDPNCWDSGDCEVTFDFCRDGIDNDNNGLVDCEQSSCWSTGACDAFATNCTFFPIPQSGCPVGMGCYRSSMATTGMVSYSCRLEGSGKDAAPCNGNTIGALMPRDPHECGAGYGCFKPSSAIGTCGRYCNSDDDCPRGGVCQLPKICTSACNPLVTSNGCQTGYLCGSFHQFNISYANGGARWFCVDQGLVTASGNLGDACDDPPTSSTPPARVCRSQYACVPGAGGAFCRAVCNVDSPACPSGTTCQALYPGKRPSGTASETLGVCL